MLLRKLNMEDAAEEYRFYSQLPKDENGFTNPFAGVTEAEFSKVVLPKLMGYAEGKGLPAGYVLGSEYFLWDRGQIVGLFRLRHRLTPSLAEGAGHIGYSIRPDCRGKGYASGGLALLIPIAKEIVPEEALYLRCLRSNPGSLQVMLKNGAFLHHSDAEHHYTRIPLR